MNISKWDKRFIDMAILVSSWSKDPDKKVGAVITDPDHRVISVGFNGLPRGLNDSHTYMDKTYKLASVVHAEANAITFANQDLYDCTIYSSFPLCAGCASLVIQNGITKVVQPEIPDNSSWKDSCHIAISNMQQLNIEITTY